MLALRIFEQLCRFLVLTKRRVNEDQVLDCVWVSLILRLNLSKELLAFGVLAQLHETKSLDCNEKCLLLILEQAYEN